MSKDLKLCMGKQKINTFIHRKIKELTKSLNKILPAWAPRIYSKKYKATPTQGEFVQDPNHSTKYKINAYKKGDKRTPLKKNPLKKSPLKKNPLKKNPWAPLRFSLL